LQSDPGEPPGAPNRAAASLHQFGISSVTQIPRPFQFLKAIRQPAGGGQPPVDIGNLVGDLHGNGGVREVVAILQAGGGVGATALAAQTAMKLAEAGRSVCVADLDIQFGGISIYLDRVGALSVSDLLRDGAAHGDTDLGTVLAQHDSGVRLLAAPDDLTPLESLNPAQMGLLVGALQRQFDVTLLDLPAAWTAWTCRALSLASRIVLVTKLSVPHMGLLNRQLRALSQQGLDHIPLTLVCNAVSADQTASLPLKTAEQAIGRPFDLVLPHDAAMTDAVNQGVPLSAIKRAGKLDRSLDQLVQRVATPVVAGDR